MVWSAGLVAASSDDPEGEFRSSYGRTAWLSDLVLCLKAFCRAVDRPRESCLKRLTIGGFLRGRFEADEELVRLFWIGAVPDVVILGWLTAMGLMDGAKCPHAGILHSPLLLWMASQFSSFFRWLSKVPMVSSRSAFLRASLPYSCNGKSWTLSWYCH